MWATDFPHQDSEWPCSMDVLAWNFARVPADETYRMVAGNALDFFHLGNARAEAESRRQAVGTPERV